jgi:hypothetical protein
MSDGTENRKLIYLKSVGLDKILSRELFKTQSAATLQRDIFR